MSLNLNAVVKIGETKDKKNALVIFKKDAPLFAEHLAKVLEDDSLRARVLYSSNGDTVDEFLKFCCNNIITTSEYAVYENLLKAMKNDKKIIDSVYTQVTGLFNLSGLTKKVCSKASYAFGSSDWLDNFSDLQQCNSEKLAFLAQTGRVDNAEADFSLRYADLEAPRIVNNVYTWLMDVNMNDATKTAQIVEGNGIELTARYLTLETIGDKFVFVASVFPEEELKGEAPERTRLIYDHKKSTTYRMPMTSSNCDSYWDPTTTYKFARMFTDMHQIGFILANSKVVNGVLTSAKAVKNGASNFASGAVGALKNIGLIEDNAYANSLRNTIAIIVNAYGKKNLQTKVKGDFMNDYNKLFNKQHKAKGKDLEQFVKNYLPTIANIIETEGKMEEVIPVDCYKNIEGDFLIRETRNDAPFTKTVSVSEGMELKFFNLLDEGFEIEEAIEIKEDEETGNKEIVPSKSTPVNVNEYILDAPENSAGNVVNVANIAGEEFISAVTNNLATVVAFAKDKEINSNISASTINEIQRMLNFNRLREIYSSEYMRLSNRFVAERLLANTVVSDRPLLDMVTGNIIQPNNSVQVWRLLHEDLVSNIVKKESNEICEKFGTHEIRELYRRVFDAQDKGKFGSEYDKAADIVRESSADRELLFVIQNYYYAKYFQKEATRLVLSDRKYAENYVNNTGADDMFVLKYDKPEDEAENNYCNKICNIIGIKMRGAGSKLMLDVLTEKAIEKASLPNYKSIEEFILPEYLDMWKSKFDKDFTNSDGVLKDVVNESSNQETTPSQGKDGIVDEGVSTNEQQNSTSIQEEVVDEEDDIDIYDTEPED